MKKSLDCIIEGQQNILIEKSLVGRFLFSTFFLFGTTPLLSCYIWGNQDTDIRAGTRLPESPSPGVNNLAHAASL